MVALTKRKDLKFVKGKGFVSTKTKSSSSKSSSSGDLGLQSRIVDAKTGKVIQEGNFNINSGSSSSSSKASNAGTVFKTTFIDERAGTVTTTTRTAGVKGSTSSRTRQVRKATPQELERSKKISQVKEQKRVSELAKRGIAEDVLEPQKKFKFTGTLSERARQAEARIKGRKSSDVSLGAAKDAAVLAGAGLASGVVGLFEIFLSPIQTTSALLTAIAAPQQTLNAIRKDIKTSPTTFLLETLGGLGAAKLVEKPVRVVLSQAKKVKVFAPDEIAKINTKLDDLSKQKQTREVKQDIKTLKANKKIISDNLRSATTAGTKIETNIKPVLRSIKSNPSKLKAKSLDKDILVIAKQAKIVQNSTKMINKAVKSSKKVKTKELRSETISKKLGEFFKEDKTGLKIKKSLPTDIDDLTRLVNRAARESGEAFSKLKKAIKTERGLNVVGKTKKGKTKYKLLEPKEQRKKGIKTAAKKEIVFDLENNQVIKKPIKRVVKIIEEIPERKLGARELAKLEKQVEKDVLRMKRTGLLNNKKAQARTTLEFKGSFNKAKKSIKSDIKTIKANIKKANNTYNNQIKQKLKNIKTIKDKNKLNSQANKIKSRLKSEQTKLNSLESKIKSLNRIRLTLRSSAIISQSASASASASISALIQEQRTAQDQAQINLQELKFPKFPPKVKEDGKGTPTRKPVTKTPTKIIKPVIEKPITRRPIKKTPITEKTKPKIPLRLSFKSKLPKGTRLAFDFRFREKGKVRTVKVGLPLNKASTRAGKLIDNTTARSMQLVISGTTKIKDTTKDKILTKFRPKKVNSKVLKLVEKSRFTIDTKGEKQGLRLSKALKKKKKK